MEAIGSSRIVERLFENYQAYIHEYVGDDDSSTKKVLRHSWQDEMDAGLRTDVPRYANNSKKPDNGLLPIEHPFITWLADKGHRVRGFSGKICNLAKLKKADCEGNSLDAERLKRNISYAIRCNCGSDLAGLKAALEAVLEHHFNNHLLCGDWCRVKTLKGKELEEAKLQYRCKEKNNKFYLQVKELFESFYELLEEMLHGWDTNIVEGMNQFFTKFLPKNRTYAMTIENKVRLYLAISIDSIGYTEVYRRIAEKSGLTYCNVHQSMNHQLDKTKSYRRTYRKLPKTKVRRMQSQYKKIVEGRAALAKANRKELVYQPGYVGPFRPKENDPTKKKTGLTKQGANKSIVNKDNVVCQHCGRTGHSRTNSAHCLKNKKFLEQTGALADKAREKGKKRTTCATFMCLCTQVMYWY
jgi:hypothetical protein